MSEFTLFEWTEEFNTGISEIDEQHKQLIDLLNHLFNLMRKGQAKNELPGAIDQLAKYSDFHFATEEKYFKLYNYPDTEKHIAYHYLFKDKIDGFRLQLATGNLTLSIDIFKYLKLWLQEHILGEDMKYRDFYKEQGINF